MKLKYTTMDSIILAALIGATATIVAAVVTIFAQRKRKEHREPETDQNFLHSILDHVDPDLQDALAIAYVQSRREGSNVIRTRYLYSALVRLKPAPLNELFNRLPRDALPGPTSEDISAERHLLAENPQLSGCIEDSLVHLSKQVTHQKKISSADIFVDIAKYGTGESVKRLRIHGVSPDKITQIVEQLGWSIIERHEST